MLFDAGIVQIYRLETSTSPGEEPGDVLIPLSGHVHWYGELQIGVIRFYEAQKVGKQIDLLIRIWQDREIVSGLYAVPADGKQYYISRVAHLKDEAGLEVSDLTLEYRSECYVVGEADVDGEN